jgi:outer membrane protein assembly factor BamB
VDLAEPVASRPSTTDRVAIDGQTVVVALDRRVVAYDAASGATRWTRPVATGDNGPLLPLVVDTTVVVVTDSQTVERIDLRTGAQVWQTALGATAACNAATSPIANQSLVFVVSHDRCDPGAPTPARLIALSLTDGTKRWERAVPGTEHGSVHATPAANEHIVVIGGIGDRRVAVTDTYTGVDASSGAVRWTTTFDRAPANIALHIAQAPRLYEDAVAIVAVATVTTDIARPAGIDLTTGQVLWFAAIGNDALIGDTLVGLDRVRDSPQQPLAAIGVDVLTGTTRWRDLDLRNTYWPLDPSSPAAFVSDRFVIVDPRNGSRRLDVAIDNPMTERPLWQRGFLLDESNAVVLTTTPQSNVTAARTSIRSRDLAHGTVLAAFDQPGFAIAHELDDDLLVTVLAAGPGESSKVVAYRVTRG